MELDTHIVHTYSHDSYWGISVYPQTWKYKSIVLEFVGNTIFLPGVELLLTKISFFFHLKNSPKSQRLCVYYLRVFLHFHYLGGPLKKELPLQSQSMNKQLERMPASRALHISTWSMACFFLLLGGSSSRWQLLPVSTVSRPPHTIRERSHLK